MSIEKHILDEKLARLEDDFRKALAPDYEVMFPLIGESEARAKALDDAVVAVRTIRCATLSEQYSIDRAVKSILALKENEP